MLRFLALLVLSTLTIRSVFSLEDDPKALETRKTPTSKSLAESDTVEPSGKIAVDLDKDDADDPMRRMQRIATEDQMASWGHWGHRPNKYMTWDQHSNRLIPVYTFGIMLDELRAEGSAYADPERLKKIYGKVPKGTLNPSALYFDQTDIYRLQRAAIDAGYTNIILMVFDGMDWQTTRATSLYKQNRYKNGRGTGLSFLDDRRVETDYGLICTSPKSDILKFDTNAQTVLDWAGEPTGGYDANRGGEAPWLEQSKRNYLLGEDREQPHTVTDSAASATSMMSGYKTYNAAINVLVDGSQVVPLGRSLQAEDGFKVGVVTSVPVTHATPACAYANNVTRKDYQDIGRDLIGLPSAAHRNTPLQGVDVLLGGGWGEKKEADTAQGDNFVPGNPYLHEEDIRRVNIKNGGKYIVAQRTPGKAGKPLLMASAMKAIDEDQRLLGFFGTKGGHLPFQTADGKYNPTIDNKEAKEEYTPADITENPTLAEMTRAALLVLEQAVDGFWLLVEAGDVDWANHANNADNAIGSVLSGDEAFRVVMGWVDENDAWPYTAVIVTADHGHYLVIDDADRFVEAGKQVETGQKQENPVSDTSVP
ncbi:MAG: alkaline phosphatase [Rhodopirellula sp.]|nr:alkaline phosphatase [Rhodopirellula sp.]OUX50741.1 MAG: alkaline phosphatase [Rhodopirellula sp. TMED283]